MPKRSKEDTEITVQKIMDAVVDQLLRLGYDKMSYTTLSQQTGISRTGISHHFPKKTDFTSKLGGRIYQLFIDYLQVDSDINQFKQSWLTALDDSKFIAILRLMFHHTVVSPKHSDFAANGIERLYQIVDEKFGHNSNKDLEWLIGKSIVSMTSK